MTVRASSPIGSRRNAVTQWSSRARDGERRARAADDVHERHARQRRVRHTVVRAEARLAHELGDGRVPAHLARRDVMVMSR